MYVCYIKVLDRLVFQNALPLPQGGKTAVHLSATFGHKEVVELLIDKYNVSATEKDVSSNCIAYSLEYN